VFEIMAETIKFGDALGRLQGKPVQPEFHEPRKHEMMMWRQRCGKATNGFVLATILANHQDDPTISLVRQGSTVNLGRAFFVSRRLAKNYDNI
jgi:hypothetical protein